MISLFNTMNLDRTALLDKIGNHIDYEKIKAGCALFDEWYYENKQDELLGAERLLLQLPYKLRVSMICWLKRRKNYLARL